MGEIKSFNQKGFTQKFLKFMKQLEDACCNGGNPFNFVTEDSSTIDFSGKGTESEPLTADVIISTEVGNILVVDSSGLFVPSASASILANNGLSKDISGNVVLGNDVGEIDAVLLSDRELPTDGFNLFMTGGGSFIVNTTDTGEIIQAGGDIAAKGSGTAILRAIGAVDLSGNSVSVNMFGEYTYNLVSGFDSFTGTSYLRLISEGDSVLFHSPVSRTFTLTSRTGISPTINSGYLLELYPDTINYNGGCIYTSVDTNTPYFVLGSLNNNTGNASSSIMDINTGGVAGRITVYSPNNTSLGGTVASVVDFQRLGAPGTLRLFNNNGSVEVRASAVVHLKTITTPATAILLGTSVDTVTPNLASVQAVSSFTYRPHFIGNLTGTVVLTPQDSGTQYSNSNGAVTFTLPVSASLTVGNTAEYVFIVSTVNNLIIDVPGTDTITYNTTTTAAGGQVTSNTPGSVMKILYVGGGKWIATSLIGTWA